MRYFLLYSDILFIGPDLFCIRLLVMYERILVVINDGIANDMSVSRLPAYWQQGPQGVISVNGRARRMPNDVCHRRSKFEIDLMWEGWKTRLLPINVIFLHERNPVKWNEWAVSTTGSLTHHQFCCNLINTWWYVSF